MREVLVFVCGVQSVVAVVPGRLGERVTSDVCPFGDRFYRDRAGRARGVGPRTALGKGELSMVAHGVSARRTEPGGFPGNLRPSSRGRMAACQAVNAGSSPAGRFRRWRFRSVGGLRTTRLGLSVRPLNAAAPTRLPWLAK
jgi:hypothetical protein